MYKIVTFLQKNFPKPIHKKEKRNPDPSQTNNIQTVTSAYATNREMAFMFCWMTLQTPHARRGRLPDSGRQPPRTTHHTEMTHPGQPGRTPSAARSANVVASSFIRSLFDRFPIVFPFGKGKRWEKDMIQNA